MRKRKQKPSNREIERRIEQSFRDKGGRSLSDSNGSSVRAVPLKGQKGYKLKL